MSLQIQFLGQTRLRRDGVPVALAGHRPLALLAYLIVTKKAHSRQQLIDLLFDGPDDPRAALRWTLSKIRKAIGEEYILADREEIWFNFESDYWADVAEFEAGELELYQGDFLAGLYLREALQFDDWLAFERGRLRGMYQAGLERQLEEHNRQGDAAAVVIIAQQLLKLDNLREDWHYLLIEAYARLGKRRTALEQFEQCRQVLRTEWNVDPAPETVALAERIRCGEIGPQVTPVEGGMIQPGLQAPAPESGNSQPDGIGAVAVQKVEILEQAQAHRRPNVLRLAPLLFGALSLVVLSAIVLSRVFDTKSQALFKPAGGTPVVNQASQPGAFQPGLAGKKVWIMGSYFGELSELFVQSMIPFEERSGIDIEFVTDNDFYLAKKLKSGDEPDIVMFPQPGRLVELAKQGRVIDLGMFLDQDYLKQQYPQPFLDMGSLDGKIIGVWYSAGLKSLVWYPRQAFESKGYQVPETWDELIALSNQIVADGGTPWCIGINDYDAKGWVGTDWVEDILLRTAPPETYDAWVRHELPFDSPEIRRVFEIMGQLWLNDEYVYGGVEGITTEYFIESPSHLFEDPPGCYLHKQGSFGLLFFPPEAVYGEDYDFFYLPPIDPEYGRPVLGSGEIFTMFHDRPEVREVMRYLSTAESAKVMIEHGGFLSPHKDTPIEWYPTSADLRFAQIVLDADTYRFDGSDLMPEEVGFGSFFRGIVDWVEGADLDTVLQGIDDSWPRP